MSADEIFDCLAESSKKWGDRGINVNFLYMSFDDYMEILKNSLSVSFSLDEKYLFGMKVLIYNGEPHAFHRDEDSDAVYIWNKKEV